MNFANRLFSQDDKDAKIKALTVEATMIDAAKKAAGKTLRVALLPSLVAIGAWVAFADHSYAQAFQDGNEAIEITDGAAQPTRAKARTRDQRGFSPRVGRRAAAKYMSPKRPDEAADESSESTTDRTPSSGTSSDHYLAIHLGWFVNDNAYKWGAPDNQTNVGRYNFGLTYRMGEWVNSMDLLFRFDVSQINLAEGKVTKFSILPVITFPDATSRFPLYFGAGLGLGVFGTQIAGESALSLDYQLLAGARFFNIWGTTGVFVEGGIKNHLFLLSDGQFNGTFIATGLVFTF